MTLTTMLFGWANGAVATINRRDLDLQQEIRTAIVEAVDGMHFF